MSLLSAQLLTALVLLVGALLCGVLPAAVLRCIRGASQLPLSSSSVASKSGAKLLSFLLCFGGGILFATCFMHMIPEVMEAHFGKDEALKNERNHNDTPDVLSETRNEEEEEKTISIPMLYIALGFFCVFGVEEILHTILDLRRSHKQSGGSQAELTESVGLQQRQSGNSNTVTHVNTSSSDVQRIVNGRLTRDSNNAHFHFEPYYDSCDRATLTNEQNTDTETLPNMIRGMMVVAALSFHSVFEGIAVGLQRTEKNIWTTGMAIAVHKFVVAFAVGLEIYSHARNVCIVFTYLAVFAAMSPIGIGIAILTGHPETSGVAIDILSAMATGTLLYVVFMEILQREQHRKLHGMLQLLGVGIGFAIMTGVQALTAKYDAD